jgi:transglutaminase-like putative cysteine protease
MKERIRQFLEKEGSGRIISRKLTKSDGQAGIFETVKIIQAMIDVCKASPRLRTDAVRVIARLPKRTGKIGDADAIFRYLKGRVKYVPDIHGVEVLQTPRYTLRHGGGDCDDLTILLASFLEAIGVPTGIRIAGRGGRWDHIYPVHWTGTAWRPIDLTLKLPGIENRKKYDMFKDF